MSVEDDFLHSLGGIAVEQWLCNSNFVGSNPAIDNVLVIKIIRSAIFHNHKERRTKSQPVQQMGDWIKRKLSSPGHQKAVTGSYVVLPQLRNKLL